MRIRTSLWAIGGALSVAIIALSFHVRSAADVRLAEERQQARELAQGAAEARSREIVSTLVVSRGATLSELLQSADLDTQTVSTIIDAGRPLVDFRRLKQGEELQLACDREGQFRWLRYRVNRDREILISRKGDAFEATAHAVVNTTETVTIHSEISSSLFEAVIAAGEHPELAVRLADIFAWDLDFYTDPRPRDTFRIVFEKKTYGGNGPPAYGRIFAAQYDNAGRIYQAILFRDKVGHPAYYSAAGKSLQKAFLRSPLKFAARISSHYSTHRLHPVLKIYRPHLGTDYAAPIGTPVQAVAHGRVLYAGRRGWDGNMVQLKHTNGYETYYLHLSRVFVHSGQNIEQGQRIGLVGATGLASGPHLDFRVRRAGMFINFEAMRLPSARPVAKNELMEFQAERDHWLPVLNLPDTKAARASAPQSLQSKTP